MKKFLLAVACLPALAFAQNLRSGGALKPEQAIMDIRHYTIALTVNPEEKTIQGYTEIDLNLAANTPVVVLDLWHGLTVTQTLVNGKKENFTHTQNDLLTITASKFFAAGKLKVKVMYGGKPGVADRAPWDGGFTWSTDSKGNPWVAITCQGEGGKVFFPCKDHPSDEPNEGADMLITVPKGLSVAGPGLLKKVTQEKSTATWHWKTNYPISNYCLVFNIGNYTKVTRTYTSVAGTKIPMEFYVLEEHADKGPHHLEVLEKTCRVLEKYFGEYPWAKEKIGIAETPHLGMEHQTMNAYGNQFKYTKVGGEDFDWLLTHEFGHEWWANKVTNSDWAHMWIQEGICSFGDALYLRELEGEEAYQRAMRRNAVNAQNKKPIVQGESVDSDDAYHSDIYGKGALFMHTLRYVIGDSLFFPTLKKLATDARYTYHNSVTTDDVEQLFSAQSKTNLKPLFDFYLRTPNKLEILVKRTGETRYVITTTNFDDLPLPLEVIADGVATRITLSKTPVTIESKTQPIPDPVGYYLKRVAYE
ncbi:MAG: M1 family metallopeptidase [Cytophagales bacterium]|nr:M1 family metallopeptidase [Cytophagales bacterium]